MLKESVNIVECTKIFRFTLMKSIMLSLSNMVGETIANNLVLSCLPCNRHKGSDLTSIDPITGEITSLFNPRSQNWAENFKLEDGYILGLASVGRTTVFLLKLNDPTRLQIRQALISEELYP